MNKALYSPLSDPAMWVGSQFHNDKSWIHNFIPNDILELKAALSRIRIRPLASNSFNQTDFPLPNLSKKIKKIVKEVESGRGFAVLKGFPTKQFNRREIEIIYWGIGTYLGTPISQNSKGDLITEVSDKGSSYLKNINDRGYMSGDKLNPHVDTSDMTVLLCLKTAYEGGLSSLASSAAIFNEVYNNHSNFLKFYYRGFHHDLRGEGPTGKLDEVTKRPIPIFSIYKGLLSCCYNDKIIYSAHKKIGSDLSTKEIEAIELIKKIATRPDIKFDFEFQVGDLQFINNYALLHSRSAYKSGLNNQGQRCLLRMWMNSKTPRPLTSNFAERYNTGPRGGIFIKNT